MRAEPISVDLVFSQGGPLAQVLPGYEPRTEQRALARAVERALSERSYLVAEAGTGTGKTLAYLVPAALSGRRVTVSTATKTLQEQIFFKDVPLLREQMGLAFNAVCLKGRSNYLCLQRWETFHAHPEFLQPEESIFWPVLEAWALRTETGDRAELDLPESFSTWNRLSTTSEACLGQKCPHYDACFVTRMRRRAEDADLVVVNHHLFFADLSLRTGRAGEGVLPSYEAVVFDEAHALEDVATDYFGLTVSSFRLEHLVADVQRQLPQSDVRSGTAMALAAQAQAHGSALFEQASRRLRLPREGSLRLERGALSTLEDGVTSLERDLLSLASLLADAPDAEQAALERRSRELAQSLRFVAEGESMDHVYWAERRSGGLFLRASPVDVAAELQERLYDSLDTAVFTSATLKVGEDFSFFSERMGLQPSEHFSRPVRHLDVASGFDFARQAALYVPAHLPEPREDSFPAAVANELIRLCALTDGRAFALFTSRRNLEAVHALVREQLPYPLLVQGEAPKNVLLSRFREQPSVLFATHSFWEGVDVAGDALSLVVMDKLPFSSPSDPLVAARVERLQARGQDPFAHYQLPEAAISLRQGFGRLIRSRSDHGIVALLDRRIHTKGYGRMLLASLPPAPVFRQLAGPQGLERWWERTRSDRAGL